MLPLHGIGVLVTRPRQQAAALCRLLEAQGASVERFAAIEIEPIDERRGWAARFGDLHQFGLIIFTSSQRGEVRRGAARATPRSAAGRHRSGHGPRAQSGRLSSVGAIDRGSRLGEPAASSEAQRRRGRARAARQGTTGSRAARARARAARRPARGGRSLPARVSAAERRGRRARWRRASRPTRSTPSRPRASRSPRICSRSQRPGCAARSTPCTGWCRARAWRRACARAV